MRASILRCRYWITLLVSLPVLSLAQNPSAPPAKDPYSYKSARFIDKQDDGYRGIWYFIGHLKDNPYVYKYAGGMATYPSNHYPFSVYVPKVKKTFFCYGGTGHDGKSLYHEVGYFNHRNGKVSRPTILLDKATGDAHDNPVLQVDKDGYIWIFSTAHGTGRPSFIHRSLKPYDISRFEQIRPVKLVDGREVPMNNFSYLQMYYDDHGFTGLFTHYETQQLKYGKRGCRVIGYMTSPDGIHWSAWKDIANIEEGHYQTSGKKGNRIGTSFNYHPTRKTGAGLDYRTNLYYVFTDDHGQSWKTADGKAIALPLREIHNPALIHDYAAEGLKVYINDLNFDREDNPVILYETTKGWEPGPENGPQQWYTAHWTGGSWQILPVTASDNNYDMGSLYIEDDGTWRIIAPTDPGPQAYNTGGSIVMWTSRDQGRHWEKLKELTPGAENNQSYPRRPVDANPEFYAFWADGNGRKPSASHLYFCDKQGRVFMLPEHMKKQEEKPVRVFAK
ncbi:BNR-4 repeat-containing protein [Compostibacter hankyongensis]|uniref:BNR-4 repeat-containing protein n=1 Tax=Compostibacter hankyongensis TaxID=1007089 RepID=UPI0031EADA7D